MKTRIIGNRDVFLNKFSEYGRRRNKVIRQLQDQGCSIIYERKENCNSRVYLGYMNQYVPRANYAVRICRNGTEQFKYSESKYSPIPSSLKSYKFVKQYQDANGNQQRKLHSLKVQDGRILENETTIS